MTRPYAVTVIHSSLGEVVRVVSADSEDEAMQMLVDRGFTDPSGKITIDSPDAVPAGATEAVTGSTDTDARIPATSSEPDGGTNEPAKPEAPAIPPEADLKKMIVPEIDAIHATLPAPIDKWADMNKSQKIAALTAASRIGDGD